MTDPETRLRDLMVAAAPANPATAGLVFGAHRYAARARRRRFAGAAVLAAAVVLVASLTTGLVGGRDASPPAAPGTHLVDLTLSTCAARAEVMPPPRAIASAYGMVASRLCALPGASSRGGDGWVLPETSLTSERWVARLRQALIDTDRHADCGDGPLGPAFVLALEERDGTILGYRSTDLACRGRAAVAAYLETMALQAAQRDALSADTNGPNCGPPADTVFDPTSRPLLDPTGHPYTGGGGGSTVLCLYPQYFPASRARLVEQAYRIAFRSQERSTTPTWIGLGLMFPAVSLSTTPPRSCSPSPWRMVLRSDTSDGSPPVEVHSRCAGVYELTVASSFRRYWTPTPNLAAQLEACVEPQPRCG
ncbi:hypothetical protein ACFUC1_05340 [Pedococcus sp. NPDC057267]|uniref:hypothetical protein n=1 Tax=Pedococcus sp. NPDC057267 TaxID=3346077 RepID=UPI003644238C